MTNVVQVMHVEKRNSSKCEKKRRRLMELQLYIQWNCIICGGKEGFYRCTITPCKLPFAVFY